MATKYLTEPVLWRSFNTEALFSEVGIDREPFIDKRNGSIKLRIFDGVTPGGKPIGGGLLNVVSKPSIVSPLDSASGISLSPIITASPYGAVNPTADPHASTRWQIASDALFTTVVYDTGLMANNLTMIDLATIPLTLDYGITYYVRVMYRSITDLDSEWSTIISFTTETNLKNNEVAHLLASDNAFFDNFGRVVAISNDGNTIIVGAERDDNFNGSAYIYVKNNGVWSEQAKLTLLTGVTVNQHFGWSVDITDDGNMAVIGAIGESPNIGRVFVFTRSGTTWTNSVTLTPSDSTGGDGFGHAVSISGDGTTVIAGMNASGSSSVYVFTRSGTAWSQQAIVNPTVPQAGEWLGGSISINTAGDMVAIGARGYDTGTPGTKEGGCYIFTRSNNVWTQQAILVASDGAANDNLGWSVALSGDGTTVVASAVTHDANGDASGAAYIFTRSGITWTQQAKLIASDGAALAHFGRSVTITDDGNMVMVGASGAYVNTENDGAVYIFTRSNNVWTQLSKYTSSTVEDKYVGWSMDITGDGSTSVVGVVYGRNLSDVQTGSAYVLE